MTKKLYKKTNYKTKETWLEAKDKTIGGSEAAAIVNKSKWLTPNDIYNKMVLGKRKTIIENEKMRDGIEAEEHIRGLYAIDHNKELIVKNPPKSGYWLFVRKDKPYLSCTPDGLIHKITSGSLWGLEIKNVDLIKGEDKRAWEDNMIPDQYLYQLLQYMVVFNDMLGVVLQAHLKYYERKENGKYELSHAVDKSFTIYREEFEPALKYLEKKETEFYEQNIRLKKRPKLVLSI